MRQLTVRGFTPDLEAKLNETARQRGWSLNRAAIYFMRRGAGLREAEEGPLCIGAALDRYCGALSAEEVSQIDRAVRELDRVDDEGFWR